MSQSLPEYHSDRTVTPDDYQPYIGKEGVDRLKRLADPVRGKSWASLSSTFQGGGVAEMLQSVIPLLVTLDSGSNGPGDEESRRRNAGSEAKHRAAVRASHSAEDLSVKQTGRYLLHDRLSSLWIRR